MNALATKTAHIQSLTDSLTQEKEHPGKPGLQLPELAGRALLSLVFLFSGLSKLGSYAATASYMSSLGVPSALLPIAIATEVVGGLAMLLGWKVRLAALLLAGYTLLTAVIFHNNFADQMQLINFLKNVSIAGGLLLLAANGPGTLSMDRRAAK